MAVWTTELPTTYSGGSDISSYTISCGYANNMNRVMRFAFKTDEYGASAIEWTLSMFLYDGSNENMRWYIGNNGDSHVNAGKDTTEYCGDVEIDLVDKKFSGSANIILMPNTTYYLYIFPATTTYCVYAPSGATVEPAIITPTASAGIIYIDNGTDFVGYQTYIDNGTGWDLCIPYIDNGTSWDIYS